MGKSIRSKVKKRFRTVKRGVIKQSAKKAEQNQGIQKKTLQALAGEITVDHRPNNWFRSDEPGAIVPQNEWKPADDFRAETVPDAGYALRGVSRPKSEGDTGKKGAERLKDTDYSGVNEDDYIRRAAYGVVQNYDNNMLETLKVKKKARSKKEAQQMKKSGKTKAASFNFKKTTRQAQAMET